jgi:hypothetical protein
MIDPRIRMIYYLMLLNPNQRLKNAEEADKICKVINPILEKCIFEPDKTPRSINEFVTMLVDDITKEIDNGTRS